MSRVQTMLRAAVLGVLVVTTPPAVADEGTGYNDGDTAIAIAGTDLPPYDGGATFGQCAVKTAADPTPEGTLGGAATYAGALVGAVVVANTNPVQNNPAAARVACELRVNGVAAAGASSQGVALVLLAAPVTYSAAPTDVVTICTIVDNGAVSTENCAAVAASTVVPEQVGWAVDTVAASVDAAVCPYLERAEPGLPGVVDIAVDGDVSVDGTLLWDCMPYQPSAQGPSKATAGGHGGNVGTDGGGGGGGGNDRHDLTSTCMYKRSTGTITGTARAGAHAAPTWTRIRCRLFDPVTGATLYDQTRTEPGPQANINDVVPAAPATVTICTTGHARWTDAHEVGVGESCTAPS